MPEKFEENNEFHGTIRNRGLEEYKKFLGVNISGLVEEQAKNGKFSVLDVGCGNGNMISELSELRPDIKVVGIDEHNYVEQRGDVIHDKLEDFNTQEKFDLIVSVKTFHYIPDKITALLKVYSLLKEGGVAFINFPSDLLRVDEQIGQPWQSNEKENTRLDAILEILEFQMPGITYEYPDVYSADVGYAIRSDFGRFVIRKNGSQGRSKIKTIKFEGISSVGKYLASYYRVTP